jgi:hypothetical protein
VNGHISERYDTDLWPLRYSPWDLEAALAVLCVCGHTRQEHYGANGALASFGGTACECCWECPTFRPVIGASAA